MNSTSEFISVQQARDTILDALSPLGPQRCLLTDALGRRLHETILGPRDAPAFDNSAMDGFAFRYSDSGRALEVIGESAAGSPFSGVVTEGQATRIMTGAAMPLGADTVAMREICSVDGAQLTIEWAQVSPGDHVRRRAAYMREGEAVLTTGARLEPADIGLLASFGRTVVGVHRQPRVGLLTTGSELVEPDAQAPRAPRRDQA